MLDSQMTDHMPYYRKGVAYYDGLLWAIHHATNGSVAAAQVRAIATDRLLWPLGDLTDPEDLRDFIAGMAHRAETHLRGLGVVID